MSPESTLSVGSRLSQSLASNLPNSVHCAFSFFLVTKAPTFRFANY
uniref:Uncharacterized protein n=1 Tax=Anguilla anguilla TaxID=7936 RepID=A0A0E9U206_ANGAN